MQRENGVYKVLLVFSISPFFYDACCLEANAVVISQRRGGSSSYVLKVFANIIIIVIIRNVDWGFVA